MADAEDGGLARDAVNDFIRYLASREYSAVTQRLRRHYLEEYLRTRSRRPGRPASRSGSSWTRRALTRGWLTRRRQDPDPQHPARSRAAAYTNSMRVRVDTYNAFAQFLGRPDRSTARRLTTATP